MVIALLATIFAVTPACASDAAASDAAPQHDATTDAATDAPAGDSATQPPALQAAPVDPNTVPTVDFDGVVGPDSPDFDLEVLYHEGHLQEGLKKARAELAAHPHDVNLHVQVARFMFEIGEHIKRDDKSIDKKAWYEEMIRVSQDGLKLKPGDPHLEFALGIAYARLGTTRGVLSSLFLAKDVEQAWLAAANSDFRYSSLGVEEMLPCDAYMSLGVFYRLVPDWWIVKVLAGTRGDLDKSLSELIAADQCFPGRISVVKELGVTQECIGVKRREPEMVEKGKATLARGLAMSIVTKSDRLDARDSKMLIEHPENACGYSRDGEQDLDEKKLDTGN